MLDHVREHGAHPARHERARRGRGRSCVSGSASMRAQMRAASATCRAWKDVPPMRSISSAAVALSVIGNGSTAFCRRSVTPSPPTRRPRARSTTSRRSSSASGMASRTTCGYSSPRSRTRRCTSSSCECVRDDALGPLRIEALAGKDVGPDVAAFGEGVKGDVALRDQYEAGDAPVLLLVADIPLDVRSGDLRHPDAARESCRAAPGPALRWQATPGSHRTRRWSSAWEIPPFHDGLPRLIWAGSGSMTAPPGIGRYLFRTR